MTLQGRNNNYRIRMAPKNFHIFFPPEERGERRTLTQFTLHSRKGMFAIISSLLSIIYSLFNILYGNIPNSA